jgi:hypothetical protein
LSACRGSQPVTISLRESGWCGSVSTICDLVHAVLLRIVSPKRPPEITVDWTKIAGRSAKLFGMCFVSPLGPDIDAARAQICFTRVAGQEPEQLFRDPAKGNSLRSDNRKTLAQIESCLKAEV